jgi:PilZ domain-containing protein
MAWQLKCHEQVGQPMRHEIETMTAEMAFECVLVSDDPAVVSTMDPILHDFSISTRICQESSRVGSCLGESGTDLVVVDLETANSAELLRKLQDSQTKQKPTVLAVSEMDRALPGVHIILRKPVTHESGMRSLKVAYSRMLQDFRKHARFPLMQSVVAIDQSNRTFPVTITNIGAGGAGLATDGNIEKGSIVSFSVRLPGLQSGISVRARVLWTRPDGVGGCEFVHIPVLGGQLLHAWLESRYRVKKPTSAVE